LSDSKEDSAMRLAREVLDKEILDCDGFKGGKVDDLLLELRAGEPPVVRAIVTQQGALARVLGHRTARLNAWLRGWALGQGPDIVPVEIGWAHVTRIDVTVHINLSRADADLLHSEKAIWERWISRLPWARR